MKIHNTRERLLASSMICGVAFLGLATQASAAAADTNTGEVSEIVVTGTRIPSPNLTSIAPVTTVGNADIKAQGVTRIEDITNSLPQVFAGQGSMISNASSGTATVDLRGLGSNRTLVLIDSRRLMPGDPVVPAADLNFIPAALVERVDVLTGGASATYGADAVAGVVNFIMVKNFEGVRIDAQYSGYQHDNNNSEIQSVVRAKAATASDPHQFALPSSNIWDGEGSEVTITLGANAPDGKGNVTAYAAYRQNNPVLEGERDFSSCTLNSGATFAAAGCGGSGTAFPARVGSFIVNPANFNTFRPRTGADVFNFGPQNYFVRPDERYNLGAFAHYEIAPWAEAYMDTMFMDDRSTAQIAAGGIFAGTFSVNCANPLLSAQEAGMLVPVGATAGQTCANTPGGTFTGTVARRLQPAEAGGRQTDFRHTDYRIVIGLRGDLGKNWNYDGYMQYGSVQLSQEQTGNLNSSRIQQALNVVQTPTGPQCAPGADAGCVPLNIFTSQFISPAALKFLDATSFAVGNTTERVVSLAFTGKLGDYGLKSAWANDGVGVAFGAEYRREHLDSTADFLSANGLVNGNGAASPPVNGGFDVYELFGEARVPLISDMPFAKDVSLELGYRFSDYSSIGDTNTYKVAGEWEVIDGLRFRAGYNRAVRAPNVIELFAPQNVGLDGTQDPCAGLAANNPLVAQCASAFHLTTAQVLAIEKNPANQYNGQFGGNPNLKPEISDTYTAGVVWQPKFVPGLSISVDYFDIKVDQFIAGLGANLIINQCVTTQNPFFCNLVHREPGNNSLFLDPTGFIQDTTLNTGSLKTTGIDLNVAYRTDLSNLGLGDNGSISASLVGTWLDTLQTQPLPGGPTYDCAGLYGTTCAGPNGEGPAPVWRHKLRVTWTTPYSYGDWFKSLSLSAQWRYYSSVKLDAFSSDPQLNNPGLQYATDRSLAARSYLDLTANFTVHGNLNFRVGVNNVLDKDPPIIGSSNCPVGACNGGTYPQVYDALGRFFFVGLTADF
ncbi:TonB-dependent receptor domain-containing protein [Phenylobacterium sp.]|uniref:TonB-dependent receptor domain-containing protein n=1 Tax=Phenylobacterium sp. TaxID=1871053 RepID=UPI002E32D052|nr:TonB-dependent receptor [Phenylobacterium sp.]HEX3367663.1 TonB-dependent receptor [Phenylobacterium sp.]